VVENNTDVDYLFSPSGIVAAAETDCSASALLEVLAPNLDTIYEY
jgi:hypothetical protein